MNQVWRITVRRHARTAFSGEGARLHGGRWNPPGVAVVYTAGTLSLAALELLAHLNREEAPADLVALAAEFPDGVRTETLDAAKLPHNWRSYPAPLELQRIGAAWVEHGRTAVLSVPSAIVPEERGYLLNPAHADFRKIRIQAARPFHFDPRFWK